MNSYGVQLVYSVPTATLAVCLFCGRWNRNKRASWAYTLPSLSPTEGSDSESISAVPVSRTAATCDAQVCADSAPFREV